jgi:hypothetical protein
VPAFKKLGKRKLTVFWIFGFLQDLYGQ